MTEMLRASELLAAGDVLAALSLVSGLHHAPARALRGIALAQLEELDDAETELTAAAEQAEREGNIALHARCRLALADILLAARRLERARMEVDAVRPLLAELGDERNLAFLQLLTVRRGLLAGELDTAAETLEALAREARTPGERCVIALTVAEREARRCRPEAARLRLREAEGRASEAGHRLLEGVVRSRLQALTRPVARHAAGGAVRDVSAPEVENLLRPPRPKVALVDALRLRVSGQGPTDADFSTRRVPFSLLVELARRAPEPVRADELIAAAFEETRPNESHHSRLRVGLGRLRELLPDDWGVVAHDGGWRVCCPPGQELHVLLPLDGQPPSALLALLADGEAWSTPDLATCLGRSVRGVQRDLSSWIDQGLVTSSGQARARRYRAVGDPPGIASQLLLAGLVDSSRHSPHDEPPSRRAT